MFVNALDDVLTECRKFPGPMWEIGNNFVRAALGSRKSAEPRRFQHNDELQPSLNRQTDARDDDLQIFVVDLYRRRTFLKRRRKDYEHRYR